MAETLEQTKRRLVDDGWFHKLYKLGEGEAACPRCGFKTSSQGECVCHEADRHNMSVENFLETIGMQEEASQAATRKQQIMVHGRYGSTDEIIGQDEVIVLQSAISNGYVYASGTPSGQQSNFGIGIIEKLRNLGLIQYVQSNAYRITPEGAATYYRLAHLTKRGDAGIDTQTAEAPGSGNRFVVGFLFNERLSTVLMIRQKTYPMWQEGILNGVGGKIELGEHPDAAMVRTFQKDTSYTGIHWRNFCRISGPDYALYCYCASDDALDYCRSTSDDVLYQVGYDQLEQWENPKCIPNCLWLTRMAKMCLQYSGTPFYNIKTTKERS